MNIIRLSVTTLVIVVGFSGCMSHSGKMIMAPVQIQQDKKIDLSSTQRVKGESCRYRFLMFPWGDSEDRVNLGIKNAIANGQEKGLKGDSLTNTTVEITSMGMMMYNKNCLVIEGDLGFKNKSTKD
ncbi:hypothetical protein JHD46_03120 [Sulfurimonas sp. SAG-AH-194-C20]|nr:hypothetical protein [Sulfurimonas sp. SAG-AH-194-C20]MDF1878626.1 hypothetical protein [Sulfurimonas sp. SAG-AH-194-C20]